MAEWSFPCWGASRRFTSGCARPEALQRASQVAGEIRVAEFALANEPEEYEFTCTADSASGSADAQVRPGALPNAFGYSRSFACAGCEDPLCGLAWSVLARSPAHFSPCIAQCNSTCGMSWALHKCRCAVDKWNLACRQTCGRQWQRSAGGCTRCWSSMWPSWGSCDAHGLSLERRAHRQSSRHMCDKALLAGICAGHACAAAMCG